MRKRCGALDRDRCRCLRPEGHNGPCDFSYTPVAGSLAVEKVIADPPPPRPLIVVDGAGRPLPNRTAIPRCESTCQIFRCAYAARHEGPHCNPTGTRTW
jgi:hypothetical protein